MKTLVALVALLCGISTAHAGEEKNCKLEGGLGPFENFQLTLSSDISEVRVGDEVKISGYFNRASGSVYTDRRINWKTTVDSNSGPITFLIDYIDWASIKFFVDVDDEGISAYVQHRSDGPVLNSYYRCN